MIGQLSFEARDGYLDTLDHVSKLISHYIQPFRPGRLKVTAVDDLYLGQKIVVESTTFRGHDFTFDLSSIRTVDIYTIWTELGIAAGKHFASIYIPPGPNIVLGEN